MNNLDPVVLDNSPREFGSSYLTRGVLSVVERNLIKGVLRKKYKKHI